MEVFINAVLLTLLVLTTIAILRQRSLFGVVILAGIYSFLMASVMIVLDAVDVAMTEASVGAGVSTIVLLATLFLTQSRENPRPRNVLLPLFVSLSVAAALIYGTVSLPPFGTPDAPIHLHTTPYYLQQSIPDTGVSNIVTSVLGDYRGFDTLGETTVIFTAGMGVMLLLKGRRRRKDNNEGSAES
jgi:multicomponent Na+:H+ antiporter subunit B